MTTPEQYHAAPSEFGPRAASYPYPQPTLDALRDELATLRADNDARGELIEQLRAELTKAERTINTMAVRLDIANADFERQQRLTALFVRALREMTPGAE